MNKSRGPVVIAVAIGLIVLAVAQRAAAQAPQNMKLTWVDRSGKTIETVGTSAPYIGPDLSPDGKRIAVHRHEGDGGDVWLLQSGPDAGTRFTGDGSNKVENSPPIWSPDGTRIVYGSTRNGKGGLYTKRADGTGPEELLIESEASKVPMSWSRDGKYIVYWVPGQMQWILPLTGDRKPFQFSEGQSSHAQISPDGKWVAYLSFETGRGEVYVKPFPTGSGKWRVSKDGGVFARWKEDGSELYFLAQPSRAKMMAVEIRVNGSSIQPGEPRALFDSAYVNVNHPGGNYHTFAVSPDGQRFLIPRPDLSTAPDARTLTLFDRDGKTVRTIGERGLYNQPVFSPDQKQVAVVRLDPEKGTQDIWVIDAATGKGVALTSSPRDEAGPRAPVWSPDGKQVAYIATRTGTESIYRRAANAETPEELLYKLNGAGIQLTDWSLDGRYLNFYSVQLGGNILFALPLEGERKPIEAARSEFQILAARLSPDSRYLAYRSNESGKNEIWVRSFNPSGGNAEKWQISTEGGLGMVAWRADGRELYYLGPDRGVMAVGVRTDSGFEFGKPRLLFKAPDSIPVVGTPGALASVGRDGERFLFAVPPPPPPPAPLQRVSVLDRQGKTLQTFGDPGRYVGPTISPDAARVAVMKFFENSDKSEIWIFDVATGKGVLFAGDLNGVNGLLWSTDGNQLYYVTTRTGGFNVLLRKRADGSGSEELMYRHTPGAPLNINDVSRDGKLLTFVSGGVIFVLPLTGDASARQPVEWLRDEYSNNSGRLSPDGRSIAYISDESGRPELWVRAFDPSSLVASEQGKRKLTNDGASVMISWRADGRELYYRKGDLGDALNIAVDATPAAGAQVPAPRYLFRAANTTGGARNISPDGERFAVVTSLTPSK
jgi:Tol biopolymer transport system component